MPNYSEVVKLAFIAFASITPYLFTWEGEFVFDDSEAILRNEDVTNKSLFDTACFYNDFWGKEMKSNLSHKSYRPLTVFTFRFNYILSGYELIPSHFKFTNIICHSITCIFLYLLCQVFMKSLNYSKNFLDVPFWASLIFAVHPVHVEAVCGIVGRADILAAITFFIAFLLYSRSIDSSSSVQSFIYVFTAVLVAGISMLFKESGVTVLGFCILYELLGDKSILNLLMSSKQIYFQSKLPPDKTHLIAKSAMRICLLCMGAILLLIPRWWIMGQSQPVFQTPDNPASFADSLFTRVATYNYIYFLNFVLLVWPHWLCFDWAYGCIPLIKEVYDYRIIFIIILYLYGFTFLVFLLRGIFDDSKRALSLSLALILIPFLPATNILFRVGFVIAERVLYIPSAGYCILLTVTINRIAQSNYKNVNQYIKPMLWLLVIIFGTKSYYRSYDWTTEKLLYTSGLEVCPLNAKVHYNIAKMANKYNDTILEKASYEEAIRVYPEYYQALNNLGNLIRAQGDLELAEEYYKRGLRAKSDFTSLNMNYGILLAQLERYDEAEYYYKQGLKSNRNSANCYYNLGNLFLAMKRYDEAYQAWANATLIKPLHHQAWANMLSLLENSGQTEKAMEIIPEALRLMPDQPSINFHVANLQGRAGNYEEAEKHFLRTIELLGDKVQALHYSNLGVLYHRWKKYQQAEDMYSAALKVDPSSKSAKKNLLSLKKIKY